MDIFFLSIMVISGLVMYTAMIFWTYVLLVFANSSRSIEAARRHVRRAIRSWPDTIVFCFWVLGYIFVAIAFLTLLGTLVRKLVLALERIDGALR